jgi:hypothetical protein
MTTTAARPSRHGWAVRRAGVIAVTLTLGALGFNACSVINKVKATIHDIRGNKATIDAFTTKLQTGAAVPFEATYVTSGSSPATIVYAVQPPKEVAFSLTPTGGSGNTTPVHLVVNASGEYACTQPASGTGSGGQWTCQRLDSTDATLQNQLVNLYTPSHWEGVLRDVSLAAGFAGDKVTSSNMTVNGFTMSCVDLVASGVPGTSSICSTSQDILGYVHFASTSTTFSITAYSASPSSSLFELPPGAKVTTSQNTNS